MCYNNNMFTGAFSILMLGRMPLLINSLLSGTTTRCFVYKCTSLMSSGLVTNIYSPQLCTYAHNIIYIRIIYMSASKQRQSISYVKCIYICSKDAHKDISANKRLTQILCHSTCSWIYTFEYSKILYL